ncbi:hypothetical protein KC19_8G157000 [Ceratodon purpureus]|uniref:Uncharacterized protein n=1 Tax=Ceratodon purpureus TaxID=3225 RepID=A0A8T0H1K9_CERPU|nr:hypothetical protein KC19_8G157000 [Ceratodon purpureus]
MVSFGDSRSSGSDSEQFSSVAQSCDTDVMTDNFNEVFRDYINATKDFCGYLNRKWAERTGRDVSCRETLDCLLGKFGIMPESARAALRAEFPRYNTLVWEHWVSSVMFNDFEDPLYGLMDVVNRTVDSVNTLDHSCENTFQRFWTKKYLEVFPLWLVQDLTQCRVVHRDRHGSFGFDRHFQALFIAVARCVWILHHFGPFVHLLRAPPGTQFEATHHLCEKRPCGQRGRGSVAIMICPGFCVENEVLKQSYVVCTQHRI